MTRSPEADADPAMPLPEDDLLEGTGYRTCEILDHGTMGEVVVAEHATFGHVVVKLLRMALAGRTDLNDRMRLEARVLARLNHTNIVRFLDFGGTPGGRPFLVMERLVGGTLRSEMAARGRFPVAEAIAIARQTLSGLAAAHAMGILHRDIKPANLFLATSSEGPPVLKILDFGVAKILDNSVIRKEGGASLYAATAPGTRLGTPRYLSPEQVSMQPLDERADLYAVGLVLYAMLAGKGPFDELSGFLEIMRAHLEVTPPPISSLVPEIPRQLDQILVRALAKRRENRFASAEEFIAALDGISARSGASEPPEGERVTAPALPPGATMLMASRRTPTPSMPNRRSTPTSSMPNRRSSAARLRRLNLIYVYLAVVAGLLLFAAFTWISAWIRMHR